MGALAAFGDPFFRSALPTFVASVACLAALVGGAVAGIVTLLLLFNAVHFAIRVWGVSVGFREGCAVLMKVAHWFNQTRTHRIKLVASIIMGMVLVAMTMTFGNVSADSFWLVIAAAASCVTSGIILTRWSRLQQLAIPLVILILVLIEVAI
jgi:mannose/fructose/N-acetylgalactosamine-specific phosphotransferase system component IID